MKTQVALSLLSAILLAGCSTVGDEASDADTDSPAEILELSVGPEKVDCVGVGPMKCLIVNGSMFYDRINGFQYEEGYQYELLVERREKDPAQTPADASRYSYELLQIKSQYEVVP